jgi:UDP-N-acetylmuramoyl-tripeptide--D-alanyl-D-alanine ligase
MLGIDTVIAIGEKAALIADGAEQNGGNVLHYATKEEAVETLKKELDVNTVMLVKASHSMRFEVLADLLQKYYD